MIKVSVYRDESGRACGFHCVGHAGYAAKGQDIICAAVSALTMTAVNAVEQFSGDTFSYREKENAGEMDFKVTSPMSEASELILKSLLLGLSMIEESYGRRFIRVDAGN